MRYENTPYMLGMIRLGELVFADYVPYRHPTIGSMADLDGAKLEWVKSFYDAHYAPRNAVLTITGDFDRDEAVRLAREYFGSIDKQGTPRAVLPPAPQKVEARRDEVRDSNAKTPGFFFGYLIPPMRTPEHYALEMATLLLSDGESSRLHRLLVRDKAVAQRVSAYTHDYFGPDQFSISVVLNEKAPLDAVQKLVQDELTRLAKQPISVGELEKARTRLRSAFVFGLQTNMSRAIQFGEYESKFDDARLLTRELAQYQAVTAEDIQRAVSRYLTPERRQTVVVVPIGSTPAAPGNAKVASPVPGTSSPAAGPASGAAGAQP
jgi:predicted Zn-dependent peptidase